MHQDLIWELNENLKSLGQVLASHNEETVAMLGDKIREVFWTIAQLNFKEEEIA